MIDDVYWTKSKSQTGRTWYKNLIDLVIWPKKDVTSRNFFYIDIYPLGTAL